MAVRVRGLTRGGYLEQVRGYCRDAQNRQPFPIYEFLIKRAPDAYSR